MHSVKLVGSDRVFNVGKIVCLARNFMDHIRELANEVPDRAVLFCKPASSIIGNGETIVIPTFSSDCHHELELALLIGKSGKNIPEAKALDHIAGYAVSLDMTLRDVQGQLKAKGLPWDIAKGFDTSCPLSDFVAAGTVADPQNLEMCLKVNGEVRQQGNTNLMMRNLARIINEISQNFTLEEGDIILTGTPAGVGPVKAGDVLDAEIEQVGQLRVGVA
jgi:5-carboxymethyl-2-hydroxymuconate isomerase